MTDIVDVKAREILDSQRETPRSRSMSLGLWRHGSGGRPFRSIHRQTRGP